MSSFLATLDNILSLFWKELFTSLIQANRSSRDKNLCKRLDEQCERYKDPKTRAALLKTYERSRDRCFQVKTSAADPRSVLIDLEAIVPSLPLKVLHCRADAVAKLEYSRRVLYLVVCGHIEA